MTTTAGFYRFLDGELRCAPTAVYLPNGGPLLASEKDSYTYPYQGWSWFDSLAAAEAHYEINGATNTDWAGFRHAILTENGYVAAMALALDSENDSARLAVTFSHSRLDRFQDKRDFAEYLQGLLLIVSVQPEQNQASLVQEFLALAARCNLPMAFITALNQAIIAMTPPSA
jgi:hypothetical protein